MKATEIIKILKNYIKEHGDLEVFGVRWPEAEKTISKNPELAYLYARYVIKGRWPKAEETIKSPELTYLYARDVIKDRWPKAEKTIIKNPEWIYKYARDVIKSRWPEAEKIIIEDLTQEQTVMNLTVYQHNNKTSALRLQWVCKYAHDVIKGRWPEAEPIIHKNSYWAYLYASMMQDYAKDYEVRCHTKEDKEEELHTK